MQLSESSKSVRRKKSRKRTRPIIAAHQIIEHGRIRIVGPIVQAARQHLITPMDTTITGDIIMLATTLITRIRHPQDTMISTMDEAMTIDRDTMMTEGEIEAGAIEISIWSEEDHIIGGQILVHDIMAKKTSTIECIQKRSIGIGGIAIAGVVVAKIDESVEGGPIAVIEKDGPLGVEVEGTGILLKMTITKTNRGHESLEVASGNETNITTRRSS